MRLTIKLYHSHTAFSTKISKRMASRQRRGFCPRLMLTSRQWLRAKERTTFVFAKANTNIVRTHHPSQNKTKRTPIWCPLVLAGMDGFEPSKCQSQSLVPYRLATSQYCFSILSYFILVVKHFIKKFVFYKKLRKHQLKYDTKTCFLFGNNL